MNLDVIIYFNIIKTFRLRLEMTKEPREKKSTKSPKKRDELSKYFDLVEGRKKEKERKKERKKEKERKKKEERKRKKERIIYLY